MLDDKLVIDATAFPVAKPVELPRLMIDTIAAFDKLMDSWQEGQRARQRAVPVQV